jgi:hypothetical protein
LTAARPLLDLMKVEDMDAVDLDGLERRLDLLLRDAPGTVNSGTEGVSGGHNVRSDRTGLRGMVFHHADSINADFVHTLGAEVRTNIQTPADDALKSAIMEGRRGVEAIVSTWRSAMADAQRVRMDTDDLHAEAIAVVRAAIHSENPDFPGWQRVDITYPTWATPFSAKADGKQVFSAHAERVIGAIVKRYAVLKRGTRNHMLLPATCQYKLGDSTSTVETMRVVAKYGIDTSRTMLRKGGMIGIRG